MHENLLLGIPDDLLYFYTCNSDYITLQCCLSLLCPCLSFEIDCFMRLSTYLLSRAEEIGVPSMKSYGFSFEFACYVYFFAMKPPSYYRYFCKMIKNCILLSRFFPILHFFAFCHILHVAFQSCGWEFWVNSVPPELSLKNMFFFWGGGGGRGDQR